MGILNTAADNLLQAMVDYYVSGEYTEPFSSEQIADCVVGHAAAAGVAAMAGNVIPVVGAGLVTVITTGAVWRMYIKIAEMIGTSLKEKTVKVIASAAISNLAMNAAVMLVLSFVPGVGSFAAGVINFASVYMAGLIFLTVLTRLFKVKREDINDISNEEWIQSIKNEIKNINLKAVAREAISLFSQMRKDGTLNQKGEGVDISTDGMDDDDETEAIPAETGTD